MRGCWLFLALAAASSGCGPDCTPSADVQVTLVPAPGVDATLIAKVRVGLSVDGGMSRSYDFVPPHPLDHPSSFVLHPDTTPASQYNLAVTIEVFDANGALLEVGGNSGEVVSSGCNRLQVPLAALPGAGDGGTGDLMIPFDLIPPPADLTCTGPDEDGDGRPNSCDLCPADYDPNPVDSDLDGLPDACDPDPDTPTNRLVYFEPFDVNDNHWSGNYTVTMSYLDVQTRADNNPEVSSNSLDALPADVRVQTFVMAPFFEGPAGSGPISSDAGIFIGSSAEPTAPGTTGMVCTLNHVQGGQDSLDLNFVQNGQFQAPTQQPLQFGFDTQTLYRLRLTQKGNTYSCEAVANGIPSTTVTMQVAQAPPAPLYLALHAWHIEAQFQSVVAESVLP